MEMDVREGKEHRRGSGMNSTQHDLEERAHRVERHKTGLLGGD